MRERKLRNQNGITLVEIIIVIAIVGILASTAVMMIGHLHYADTQKVVKTLDSSLNELQVKRFIVKPRKRRPDREKLRAARKRCGFDQRTVARVLNVRQPMVSGWENGEGISRKNLQKLARLYLVEVSELLED